MKPKGLVRWVPWLVRRHKVLELYHAETGEVITQIALLDAKAGRATLGFEAGVGVRLVECASDGMPVVSFTRGLNLRNSPDDNPVSPAARVQPPAGKTKAAYQ